MIMTRMIKNKMVDDDDAKKMATEIKKTLGEFMRK